MVVVIASRRFFQKFLDQVSRLSHVRPIPIIDLRGPEKESTLRRKPFTSRVRIIEHVRQKLNQFLQHFTLHIGVSAIVYAILTPIDEPIVKGIKFAPVGHFLHDFTNARLLNP